MCGIVGVIGERNATPVLVEGLRRLEYRGYDSAGIAVVNQGGIQTAKAEGKLVNLERLLTQEPCTGLVGIGHTRWATHGPPTTRNAHPHCSKQVAVVHNGIIENYQALRNELQAAGVVFHSDTDTEVIPHLIEQALRLGADPLSAVRACLQRVHGAFALGILFRDHAGLLIAARRGSPLIVGLGEGENFIGSDATPLVPYTRQMVYLHDNDVAVLTREAVRIVDLEGQPVERPVKLSMVNADLTDKGPYRHFMLKEIYEQPTAVSATLKELVNLAARQVVIAEMVPGIDLAAVRVVSIIACGTSWHAGMVGRYWIEDLARIPTLVDIASEYRYREPPVLPGGLTIVISQSGETADTLAAMRFAHSQGQQVLAIVNVPESSIAREADGVLYTRAGPEIGVASTKAFTTQLTVLAALALAMGRANGRLSVEREQSLITDMMQIPSRMEQVLSCDHAVQTIAAALMHAKGFLFLGRGGCFPIALEGALKLKEISYIHAEGYASGEMKHGPIALIDKQLPVVVVAPRDRLFDKVISNLEEVRARGGRLVTITSSEGPPPAGDFTLTIAPCGELIAPLLYVIPLQLLAYHIAVLKGTDVDQPRNLAKSVTVE